MCFFTLSSAGRQQGTHILNKNKHLGTLKTEKDVPQPSFLVVGMLWWVGLRNYPQILLRFCVRMQTALFSESSALGNIRKSPVSRHLPLAE